MAGPDWGALRASVDGDVVLPRTPGYDDVRRPAIADFSWSVVHPWGSGGVYPNLPDPDLDDWSPAYHGANLSRLLGVKTRYDPDEVFGRRPAGSSRAG